MYELFEHTADLGLRVRCTTLGGLFEEAARALFSVIAANPDSIRPLQKMTFEIAGSRRDDLLFDWLAELLWTFDTHHVLLSQFEVDVRDAGLTATARGEPLDPGRHEIAVEVKAVTWHALKVQQHPEGWLAEVIVDV